MSLLVGENLSRNFRARGGGKVLAVDNVSLSLSPRRLLGLVGESGSGKSTTGRLMLGIEPADQGTLHYAGETMPRSDTAAWRKLRAQMQMVFQNPLGSLDRRMTIAQSVGEPLAIHGIGNSASERALRVAGVMEEVGLRPEHANRHPHELSGGQLQRAALARALVSEPRVLVLDEPLSALDVSIQAQLVAKLLELQQIRSLAVLMISHDLRLMRQICDEVAVMYLGRIVEQGTPEAVLQNPQHPYTRALVSAVPRLTPGGPPRIILQGEPPNPAQRPSGCAFHPRCAMAVARCRVDTPVLQPGIDGRLVACHLVTPKVGSFAA